MSSTRLLRDVVTLDKGKPPAQQPYFGSDAEVYLTPEYLRSNAEGEPVKASANAVRVSDGETVILWDGSNAGEVFRARRGILASTMSRARHTDAFDREYFYYALKNWEHYLKGQTSGSGIPHVDKEVLGKLELYEFSTPEQTRIAEVLSTVDRAIEQMEALIAKQQRIKTGLMQDLLTRGIDSRGNLRSEETHQFKDSPLGRIPAEWEVEHFGSACERVSVGIASSTAKHFRQDGIPLLRNQNVLAGHFDLTDMLHISPEFDAANRSKRLRSGDLVTMRTGYPGRTAVAAGRMEGWQTFTTLISSPKRTRYVSEFLALQMNGCVGRSQIKTLQGGGAQQNLNVGWVVDMLVVRPRKTEQKHIVSALASITESERANEQHAKKSRALKTALMQDLLTGKVRVTPLLTERQEAGA